MKRFYLTIAPLFLLASGCMDDVHNYNDCVQIETSRCEFRNECDPDFALDSCVAYYKEFCRTRRIKESVSKNTVEQCIADLDGLGSADQCNRLKQADKVSEICFFSELGACRKFLCIKGQNDYSGDGDTASDTDTETDTIPSGLNPS